MKWTAAYITNVLMAQWGSPLHFSKQAAAVPNCTMLNHEADILIATKAGYLVEVEVKVSRSDFRADAKKRKFALIAQAMADGKRFGNTMNKLRRFYYAMPAELWERCQDVWRVPGAGVITIGALQPRPTWYRDDREYVVHTITEVVKAEVWPAVKTPEDRIAKLNQLMAYRYWDQRLEQHRSEERISEGAN